jgi:hypothetical protein
MKKKPPPKAKPEALAKPVVGRPSEMTPATQRRIILAVNVGQSVSAAAESIPISKSAVLKWKERGRMASVNWEELTPAQKITEQPYVEFFTGLITALSRGEQYDLTIIHNAKKRHWQAAAWMRERMNPERWAKRIRLAGDDEAPPISTSTMTALEAKERAKKLVAMLKASGRDI